MHYNKIFLLEVEDQNKLRFELINSIVKITKIGLETMHYTTWCSTNLLIRVFK